MLYVERNLSVNDNGDVKMFRDYSELNKRFIRSFPQKLTPLKNWDDDSYEYFQEVALSADPRNNHFEAFHKKFLETLKVVASAAQADKLVKLFKDAKELEYCYDVALTRAYSVTYPDLLVLTNKQANFSSKEKQINKEFFSNTVSALIPGIEIANMRFPSSEDDKIYPYNLEVEKGFLQYNINKDFTVGEEVSVSYLQTSSNSQTINNYGVAAINNFDNSIVFQVGIDQLRFPYDKTKFDLCVALGCYDKFIEDRVEYHIDRRTEFSQDWLNYYRTDFATDKMAKSLWAAWNSKHHGYISLYNELSSVLSFIEILESIIESKRSRYQDEHDYKTYQEMLTSKIEVNENIRKLLLVQLYYLRCLHTYLVVSNHCKINVATT